MKINKSVEERLNAIESLPTLPAIAAQLLRLLTENNSSISRMSQLITSDPSITSKILKIANSAFYGVRKKIDTIRLAMVVLGLNEIRNIVLSVSIFRTFSDVDDSDSFDRDKFWHHSIAVGHFARVLVKELKINTHGEEFTAGLIHDIGKIVMDQYFHDDFIKSFNFSREKKISNYAAEKKFIGATHMEIGAWLANNWRLPSKLIDSIAYHHNPFSYIEDDPLMIYIVSLCNINARKFGFSETSSFEDKKIDEKKIWREIEKYSNVQQINRNEVLNKMKEEKENIKVYISQLMQM